MRDKKLVQLKTCEICKKVFVKNENTVGDCCSEICL
jgi:hypothetical protein